MQIIRSGAFETTPWKNGGGVTREVLRFPPRGADFIWRLSVAEVAASGPFSDFTGYRRTLVLIKGSGVRLKVADGQEFVLRKPGDLARFDGAAPIDCELLSGACADLNLMVRNSTQGVESWVEELSAPRLLKSMPGVLQWIFCIAGTLLMEGGDGTATVEAGDFAAAAPGEQLSLRPALPATGDAPLVFFATLNDNSSHCSTAQ